MSGQISRQSSALPQQNNNSLQWLRDNRSIRDQDRKYIQQRIYLLCQMTKPPNELQPWMHGVVKSLEESLFKHASSKEEYMDLDTLKHRVHTLLKRACSNRHVEGQKQPASHLMNSSSSISTMVLPGPALSQQMIPMTGEMYGMDASDLSGSGNIYGPAASVGSTMNNENVNSSSFLSKSKTNSGLPAHQHTQQTMQQQTANMKPQLIVGLQVRRYMQAKIYQLCKRMQPLHDWQPSLQDVIRRLDEMLFKHASSKEEYMNIDTLEHRVQTLLRDFI